MTVGPEALCCVPSAAEGPKKGLCAAAEPRGDGEVPSRWCRFLEFLYVLCIYIFIVYIDFDHLIYIYIIKLYNYIIII